LTNKERLGILFTFCVTAALLQSVVLVMPLAYAGDDGDDGDDGDEGGSQTDITQDVKQKQKCKVGNFGDPEDSTSSTTFGFCNQQGQNNFAGGGTLGSAGIPVG
jgi:hypothetical protein